MIILASAIIISLSNSNVINKANEAVSKTNMAQIKQMAVMAWADAYLENANIKNEANRLEKIKETVEQSLINQGIDMTKYDIISTDNGVDVKELSDKESKLKYVYQIATKAWQEAYEERNS